MATIDPKRKVKIENRLGGTVVYIEPDSGRRRVFAPFSSKTVEFEELEALMSDPGGEGILRDYIKIDDQEVVAALFGDVEPEYHYTNEDIKRIMLSGSVEEFTDMMNFIPEAGLENIKSLAIELPLNDVAKRDVILHKTGFNVGFAIEAKNAKTLEEVEKEKNAEFSNPQTSVKDAPVAGKPQRLAAKPEISAPKYNVVNRK